MNKYLKKGFRYLFSIMIVLIILDVVFTLILSTSIRHKGSWITSFKNQKLDYVVLGNSRAFSAFDIDTIDELTGLKGINLAVDAAGPVEMRVIYEFFVKNNEFNTVILLIDDRVVNSKQYNKKAIKHFLPFIWSDYKGSFWSLQNKEDFGIPLRYYVPFYRYVQYSSEIGMREVVMTMMSNNHIYDENGFKMLKPKKMSDKVSFYKNDIIYNYNLNKLISKISDDNKNIIRINLPYFFETPDNLKDVNKPYKVLDYSDWIHDESFFNDNVHLNLNGAKGFRKQFSEDFVNLISE